MGANSEAQIVMRFVEMAKLLNVYLNHFPRHERYALSTLIRRTLYASGRCIDSDEPSVAATERRSFLFSGTPGARARCAGC
jgi:hypothetical protein